MTGFTGCTGRIRPDDDAFHFPVFLSFLSFSGWKQWWWWGSFHWSSIRWRCKQPDWISFNHQISWWLMGSALAGIPSQKLWMRSTVSRASGSWKHDSTSDWLQLFIRLPINTCSGGFKARKQRRLPERNSNYWVSLSLLRNISEPSGVHLILSEAPRLHDRDAAANRGRSKKLEKDRKCLQEASNRWQWGKPVLSRFTCTWKGWRANKLTLVWVQEQQRFWTGSPERTRLLAVWGLKLKQQTSQTGIPQGVFLAHFLFSSVVGASLTVSYFCPMWTESWHKRNVLRQISTLILLGSFIAPTFGV